MAHSPTHSISSSTSPSQDAASPQAASQPGLWVVADPRSRRFGEPFENGEAIAKGIHQGQVCLVTTKDEGIIVLEQAQSPAKFLAAYRAKVVASPAGSAVFSFFREHTPKTDLDSPIRPKHWDRRAQLSQMDIFAFRPDLVRSRILYGFAFFVVYVGLAARCYSDKPPSAAALLTFTLAYPIVLYLIAQVIDHREQPAQGYMLELLLAFDLYQLATSLFIFFCVLREAYMLELLVPPWGHPASRSSPLLRKLVWLHYHNRIVETLDTVVRISQKKFKAYGALHIYLRLVFLWGWFALCCVGGGDIYFHTLLDAGVTSMRFFVFTLSILHWNWNIRLDFGLNAPKIVIFRKENLLHLQLVEFAVLVVHGLWCGYWNTMSRWLALFQVVVMSNGMSIFFDFHHSPDAAISPKLKQAKDSRLTFSFDSSCWLFIYHFGVAKWIQDHVNVRAEDLAFSGSSGGALVGAALACKFEAEEVKDRILSNFPSCKRNPLRMFRVGEEILDHYLRDNIDAAGCCSGVLRILLTKVSKRPPLLQAEVASKFDSWRDVFSCLRASMHVPLADGILPYPVPGRGWYYDGLVWASLFVPWRAFDDADAVVRVSACGFPGAQIRPRIPFPIWWLIMPPSEDVLNGMFWMGYRDTQEYFSGRVGVSGCCSRRSSKKLPPQIKALQDQLSSEPRDSISQEAVQLIADLHATAVKHWQHFFLCLFAVVVVLGFLTAALLRVYF